MSAAPRVYYEQPEVEVRLNQMQLSRALLKEVVDAGELARINCTANMPPCFPGSAAWAYTVTALRDLLLPAGWRKSDAGNYPLVISPDDSFSIGVATGNEYTGDRHFPPKTKFPKGPVTIEKVVLNGEYTLFGEPIAEKRVVPPPNLWLLLMARFADGVRSELSRPNAIGEDGRVDGWSERVILPTSDPSTGRRLPLPLPEPGPDFDVDIVSRLA